MESLTTLNSKVSSYQPQIMFSLGESNRYLLFSEPTDMRKSFHTLSGLVTNIMGANPHNGDVFIFINKHRNRIKLLHWEAGGMVIYSKMLERGTFALPDLSSVTSSSYVMQWRDLVLLVEGIMEKADSRQNRLMHLRNMQL